MLILAYPMYSLIQVSGIPIESNSRQRIQYRITYQRKLFQQDSLKLMLWSKDFTRLRKNINVIVNHNQLCRTDSSYPINASFS